MTQVRAASVCGIGVQHKTLEILAHDCLSIASSRASQPCKTQALLGLRKAIEEHFAYEDRTLQAQGGPAARRHIQEHARFLKVLDQLLENIASDDISSVASFVAGWLDVHLKTVDAMFERRNHRPA